jgi:transposase-like protein
MKMLGEGWKCGECGDLVPVKVGSPARDMRDREPGGNIYIIDRSEFGSRKVSQLCPKCGNPEAFRWISRVSGEHAGINTERTIKRFRCPECSYSWTETV